MTLQRYIVRKDALIPENEESPPAFPEGYAEYVVLAADAERDKNLPVQCWFHCSACGFLKYPEHKDSHLNYWGDFDYPLWIKAD